MFEYICLKEVHSAWRFGELKLETQKIRGRREAKCPLGGMPEGKDGPTTLEPLAVIYFCFILLQKWLEKCSIKNTMHSL